MLEPGDQAPDFTLPDQHGEPRSLNDLLAGTGLSAVLQPGRVRDRQGRMLEAGTRVAGVSTQSVKTHARFDKQFGLGFPVLADTDKAVCRAYGVLGPFELWTNRVSYLIGPDRAVIEAVKAGLRLGPHERLMGQG